MRNRNGGVSFFSFLGLLFIGLKLGGYIDWSWVWVTAPIWGSIVLAVLTLLVMVIVVAIDSKITRRNKHGR